MGWTRGLGVAAKRPFPGPCVNAIGVKRMICLCFDEGPQPLTGCFKV